MAVAVMFIRRHRNQKVVLQAKAKASFEAHLRSAHASSRQSRGPCILDAGPENVYHFAIGDYELVITDLQRMDGTSADAIAESLAKSGVRVRDL